MKEDLSVEKINSAEDVEIAFSIRSTVFYREQSIPAELDKDGLDDDAIHVLARVDGEPVATGRVVVDGDGRGTAARIAVLQGYRGRGIGRLVVEKLEALAKEKGALSLELHPHYYLEKFYSQLGFRTVAGGESVGAHRLIIMKKDLT